MAGDFHVGVDLGGTTISAGLVRGTEIVKFARVPTGRTRPPREIFDSIAGIVEDVAGGYPVGGIGIGVPVPAGPSTDALEASENLPTMGGFPLKSELGKRFAVPVSLENDARCMALGEHRAGALRGCLHCACITLGTGLGCGIVIGGSLYRGYRCEAGEIWKIPFGRFGSLEKGTSAGGLTAMYERLSGLVLEPEEIHGRFRDGERDAAVAFERYGEEVGGVVVMLLSLLDLERVAIGGGLARSFDAFGDALFRVVDDVCGRECRERVVPAALSDRAAVIGAASLFGM